jgi:Polyketide cyclase / dehydrase and lipid transport
VKRLLTPAVAAGATVFALRRAYRLLASGSLTLDLGVGRRLQPLGPLHRTIAAPPEVVFDVIAAPYLERTPRALSDKLQVWEQGSDLVLAAHFTDVRCSTSTTLETVRFERPARIDFRLVRGPVPHLVESFLLSPSERGTAFRWQGELGTDGWQLGEWWGRIVARAWTRAVENSLRQIAAEAERRTRSRPQREADAKAPPPQEEEIARPLVEILYFEGCPNHEAARTVVERVSGQLGIEPELRLVEVPSEEAAQRLHFLGSPTIRVEGEDVDPHASERRDYARSCRVYQTESGLAGQPDERWVRAALQRAASEAEDHDGNRA